MERRDFIKKCVWLPSVGFVMVSLVSSCSGKDDSSSDSKSADANGDTCTSIDGISISGNHGHAVDLTDEQLAERMALTLTLSFNGTHSHTVDVSAAALDSLGNCQSVTITSSNSNGHTHTVTFNPIA